MASAFAQKTAKPAGARLWLLNELRVACRHTDAGA
jgi:hypothetical protein